MKVGGWSAPEALTLAGALVLLLASVWLLRRARLAGLKRSWPVWLVLLATFFILRLPSISIRIDVYADESALITESMRSLKHPVPWRDVDALTSGPLNYWFLALPEALGAPPTWATARTMLWLAQSLTLLLLYRTLRCFGPPPAALLATLPTVTLYAFFHSYEFTHFSSETVPVLWLAAVGWLTAEIWGKPTGNFWRFFAAGLLLGSLPFAKLQAAPVGCFWGAVLLGRSLWIARNGGGWHSLLALLAGTCLFPGVLLTGLACLGAFQDFWNSYILHGLQYRVTPRLNYAFFERLLSVSVDGLELFPFLAVGFFSLFCLLADMFSRRPAKLAPGQQYSLLLAGAMGAAMYCIWSPGRGYSHYLLFLIPPLGALCGLAILRLLALELSAEDVRHHWNLTPQRAIAILAGGLFLMQVIADWQWQIRYAEKPKEPLDLEMQATLKAFIQPGDELSVWGWVPSIHILTGMPPATRECFTENMIVPTPLRDYYRNRHLMDLEKSRPAFFIDAVADHYNPVVASGWSPQRDGLESFPALASFIAENYRLIKTIASPRGGKPVCLYIRKDRLPVATR